MRAVVLTTVTLSFALAAAARADEPPPGDAMVAEYFKAETAKLRAAAPLSKACVGRRVSMATSPPSFSPACSAISSAIGCRPHCARWRCASRTSGPCVA